MTGANYVEHLQNLGEMLQHLEHHGLRTKNPSVSFLKPSVDNLGHHIDAQGPSHYVRKLDAIVQAPEPDSLQQLWSFLGMLNYYGQFIPNLATIVHPLNKLLSQYQVGWTSAQAFAEAK